MSEEIKTVLKRVAEFETTTDEYWRVDRFDLLARDFGVEAGDLKEWHDVLKAQGMAWNLAERLYQVGPMMDAQEEVLRPWTRAEVAKRYGIPVAQVDSEIDNAVRHWKLEHARRDLKREATADVGQDDIELLTSFSTAGGIDEEDISKLLEAYNFKEIKDPMMRVQVAKRILSLKDYLMSPHTRTAAREIIRMENAMHSLEKTLTGVQNKLDQLMEEDPGRLKHAPEIDGLSKRVNDLNKEIRAISLSHAKTQKQLGADDIDMTTRKRLFVETVAYIQEQCRVYESDPENVRADGVFRAGEIDWLMEPLGERAPQYRPDISVRLADALLPENLWDPEYVPPKISIRVCQELRKLVEGMRKIPEDAAPLIELDDDDEVAGISGGMVVPLEEADGDAMPPAVSNPYGRRDEGSACMGVF